MGCGQTGLLQKKQSPASERWANFMLGRVMPSYAVVISRREQAESVSHSHTIISGFEEISAR